MSKNTQSPPGDTDTWLRRTAAWRLCFASWPHRCVLTNHWIWLRWAYRGTKIITGPGDPVVLTWWMTKEEFVIRRLQGTV